MKFLQHISLSGRRIWDLWRLVGRLISEATVRGAGVAFRYCRIYQSKFLIW